MDERRGGTRGVPCPSPDARLLEGLDPLVHWLAELFDALLLGVHG